VAGWKAAEIWVYTSSHSNFSAQHGPKCIQPMRLDGPGRTIYAYEGSTTRATLVSGALRTCHISPSVERQLRTQYTSLSSCGDSSIQRRSR
jgi:hypothetical protein